MLLLSHIFVRVQDDILSTISSVIMPLPFHTAPSVLLETLLYDNNYSLVHPFYQSDKNKLAPEDIDGLEDFFSQIIEKNSLWPSVFI